jgi:hypothetical protein
MGADYPLVIVDAVIDIASPILDCSAITPARTFLLEGGPKVHQLLAILIDLGLELMKLLKLGLPRTHRSRHCGLHSWGSRGPCLLKRSMNALPYRGSIPQGNLLNLYVKAFT